MFLKKTFWSTDDDEDLIGKKKAEIVLEEKKKHQQLLNDKVFETVNKIDTNETSDDEDTCRLVSESTCKDMSTITERTEQISIYDADSMAN